MHYWQPCPCPMHFTDNHLVSRGNCFPSSGFFLLCLPVLKWMPLHSICVLWLCAAKISGFHGDRSCWGISQFSRSKACRSFLAFVTSKTSGIWSLWKFLHCMALSSLNHPGRGLASGCSSYSQCPWVPTVVSCVEQEVTRGPHYLDSVFFYFLNHFLRVVSLTWEILTSIYTTLGQTYISGV